MTALEPLQEMLSAGLIVAGWDAQNGGSVWGIPLGGTLVQQPFSLGQPITFLTLYVHPECTLTMPHGLQMRATKLFL